MAIITVTTASDVVASDGLRSLREAVAQANATAAADTIVFSSSLEGKTLTLTQGELVLSQDVTIDGDQNNDGTEVTLSGGDQSRILHITGGQTDVSLRDLNLTQGLVNDESGGAIFSGGHGLRMTDCTVSDSSVTGPAVGSSGGGGIFVADHTTLTLSDCTIRDCVVNRSDGYGGAIYANGSSNLSLENCKIIHNYSNHGSGIASGFNNIDLLVYDSLFERNIGSAAIILGNYSHLSMDSVKLNNNDSGVILRYASATINECAFSNSSFGIATSGDYLSVNNSSFTGNSDTGIYFRAVSSGDGLRSIVNSTITGNGTGISSYRASAELDLANNIISGNNSADVLGLVAHSNGHNIFGSDVAGAIIGDLQGISPSRLFAAIDPNTSGGLPNSAGAVPLRNSVNNPALDGGDPLAALATDQLSHARPQPAGSLPDIGAAERSQALSTHASANNDVITGTDGADMIAGHDGADLIRGQGGNDTLRGEAGSDLLDGGLGNDLLDGGDGINLVRFGGTTAVAVDLIAGTATRGAETDTLSSIQGAIGSSAADALRGDGGPNWFQGGGGRDVATGGAARDLYDYDHTSDSLPGVANRDVITDFAHGSDKLDLTGIDANDLVAGNQAFLWLGDVLLSGAGQANFISSGGNTIVQASTDADATPEFQIRLTGSVTLSEGDFFL